MIVTADTLAMGGDIGENRLQNICFYFETIIL